MRGPNRNILFLLAFLSLHYFGGFQINAGGKDAPDGGNMADCQYAGIEDGTGIVSVKTKDGTKKEKLKRGDLFRGGIVISIEDAFLRFETDKGERRLLTKEAWGLLVEKSEFDLDKEAVRKAVYDNNFALPEGFYKDTTGEGRSVFFGYQDHPSLYADELKDARQTIADYINKQYKTALKAEDIDSTDIKESILYFNYPVSVEAKNLPKIIDFRVHRPTVVKWESDFNKEWSATLNPKFLSEKMVRTFAEYDTWIINSRYNLGGSKILKSVTTETDKEWIHTIYLTAVVYGDWGLQDEITVSRREYKISKETGTCTRTDKEALKFQGKKN